MLLHGFTVTHVLDCLADPSKDRVIAELSDDVSPVFPYLNAVVPNLMYNPGANSVTVEREWRILTFYPHVAVMDKVDGNGLLKLERGDAHAKQTRYGRQQPLCPE
ncbi:MAG: hypothetical protein ACETWR_13460 [Anaerolineae bacterium]